MRTSLVIPCFNEAERLSVEPFAEALAARTELRLLFVDDGSRDGTAARLTEIRDAVGDAVEILTLPENRGKAEAVRRGLVHALQTAPDAVGYWDADLATPLDALDDMARVLAAQPEIQLVMGARVKLLGRSIRRHAPRHYAGRVFATCISRLLRLPVYDTQCGAKLFRVSPRLGWVFERPFLTRWLFDVEILARLSLLASVDPRFEPERAVYELPLRQWDDVPGSKLRWYDAPRAAAGLMRMWWHYRICARRRKRPAG